MRFVSLGLLVFVLAGSLPAQEQLLRPLVQPSTPDSVGVFWSPASGPGHQPLLTTFRQLGAYSPSDRVIVDPCGELTANDRELLRTYERALTDSATRLPRDFNLWFRLGCLRTLLAWPQGGATGHDGFLLATWPEEWNQRAIAALLHGASLRPFDSTVLTVLSRDALRLLPGRVPVPVLTALSEVVWKQSPFAPTETGTKRGVDLVAETLLRAVSVGRAQDEVARACTSSMIFLSDFASAYECSVRTLLRGRDSTWHALRLSWLAFQRGDAASGERWFRLAAAAARDQPSRIELGWHFERTHDWRDTYAVMLGDAWPAEREQVEPLVVQREKLAWLSLPDSAFERWIQLNLTTGKASNPWIGLNADQLRRHFEQITYSGTAFRERVEANDSAQHGTSVRAQRYRLWNPHTGEPVALFSYRVTGDDLVVVENQLSAVAQLQLRVTQSSAVGVTAIDTTVALPTSSGSGKRPPLSGAILVSGRPNLSSWTFAVRQRLSTLAGGDYQEAMAPLGHGRLALSDLVIGNAREGGIAWSLGTDAHSVATPGSTFDPRIPIRIYFQVESAAQQSGLTVTYSVSNKETGLPAFSASSAVDAHSRISEFEQSVDLSRLKAGLYRIGVQVSDHASVLNGREITIQVQ